MTERGVGYRFIATERQARVRAWRGGFIVAAGIVGVVSLVFFLRKPTPGPVPFYRIARADRAQIPVVMDSQYLYYGEWDNGRFSLARVRSTGGEPTPLTTNLQNPELCDISPDGQTLLVRSIPVGGFRDNAAPLWVIRTNGEVVGQVGEIQAVDAAWLPDGRHISYSNGPEIWIVNPDGSAPQRFTTVDTPNAILWWLRWSKDSKRLRLTMTKRGTRGRLLLEVSSSRRNDPQPLPGMDRFVDACCGSWTVDEHSYVFGATTREGATQIWSRGEATVRNGGASLAPVLPTYGLTSYRGPLVGRGGKRLFVRATVVQGEVVRYNETTQDWHPVVRDLYAGMVSEDRDGRRLAYTTLPELSLWIANADGGSRKQIAAPPLQVVMPKWSPKGDQIAFMGRAPSDSWKIYIVRIPDGTPTVVLPSGFPEQADPDWSPAADELVFGSNPSQPRATHTAAVFIVNLKSGAISPIDGSARMDSPRWSPDGHSIVAFESGSRRLMMYSFESKMWSPLTGENYSNSGYASWSHDSNQVYFLSGERRSDGNVESVIYRVDVKTGRLSRAASLAKIRQGDFMFGTWVGLDHRDAFLTVRDRTMQEIDAVDWP